MYYQRAGVTKWEMGMGPTLEDYSFYSYPASKTVLTLQASTGNVGIGTTDPKAKLHVVGLVDYANNAAAVSAGLTAGAFYTETGTNPKRVCVVY